MKTLKGTSVISGFQWGQWFRGRADWRAGVWVVWVVGGGDRNSWGRM